MSDNLHPVHFVPDDAAYCDGCGMHLVTDGLSEDPPPYPSPFLAGTYCNVECREVALEPFVEQERHDIWEALWEGTPSSEPDHRKATT